MRRASLARLCECESPWRARRSLGQPSQSIQVSEPCITMEGHYHAAENGRTRHSPAANTRPRQQGLATARRQNCRRGIGGVGLCDGRGASPCRGCAAATAPFAWQCVATKVERECLTRRSVLLLYYYCTTCLQIQLFSTQAISRQFGTAAVLRRQRLRYLWGVTALPSYRPAAPLTKSPTSLMVVPSKSSLDSRPKFGPG